MILLYRQFKLGDEKKIKPETKKLVKKLIKAQLHRGNGPLKVENTVLKGFKSDFDLRDLAE